MKKITLAIIVAFAAALAVAQGPGGRPGGPGGGRMDPKARMEKMRKDYYLTPAQVNRIEAVNKAREPEMKKLFAASKGDRKAMAPAFKKMMDDYTAKMKTILNKDQFAKWEAARKKRGMGRRGPGGPGGPGGPPKAGGI